MVWRMFSGFVGAVAVASGVRRLVKHFRVLVLLLLTARAGGKNEGKETENGGFFHGSTEHWPAP
jgi:hypothetical protein